MKQVGIFGGSFDPPHLGHEAIVNYALESLDEVWVVPCYRHPFEKELRPFEERLQFCQILFGKKEGVVVLDIEKEINEISYTFKTVMSLKKKYPEVSLRLIVGEDAYQERHLWQEIDKLEEMIEWMVIPRGKNSFIPNISASQIREKLKKKEDISELVSEKIIGLL